MATLPLLQVSPGPDIETTAPRYPIAVRFNEAMWDFLMVAEIFLSHPYKIEGVIPFGRTLKFNNPVFLEPYATINQGAFCSLGAFTYARSNLLQSFVAGRYCSIAPNCEILGIDHPLGNISTHIFTFREHFAERMKGRFGAAAEPAPFEPDRGPVRLGHDVWIGQNVLMQRGITIGDGAVVAAGSVVTKDVPPFAIVGGTPARIIRYRFGDALIERIQRVAWWQYHASSFAGLDVASPGRFLDGVEEGASAGRILPYRPDSYNIPEIFQILDRR
jgi:acetyltransferase-like isoleucine patch superfamily enzyme